MRRSPLVHAVRLIVGFLCFLATPFAHAATFVDSRLGELSATDKVVVDQPQPVQLLFAFQTDGAPNSRATNYLKTKVDEQVRASGVFSSVSATPVSGGALISVTINNIPQKGAAGKGFLTGLTFGFAGTVVTDNYEVTLRYVAGDGATPIVKTVAHALYAKVGAAADPENAVRVRNTEEAIFTVVRQSLAHTLNQIATDPAFPGRAPVVATATSAPEATAIEAVPVETASPQP